MGLNAQEQKALQADLKEAGLKVAFISVGREKIDLLSLSKAELEAMKKQFPGIVDEKAAKAKPAKPKTEKADQ